jgi:hypothetical protein
MVDRVLLKTLAEVKRISDERVGPGVFEEALRKSLASPPRQTLFDCFEPERIKEHLLDLSEAQISAQPILEPPVSGGLLGHLADGFAKLEACLEMVVGFTCTKETRQRIAESEGGTAQFDSTGRLWGALWCEREDLAPRLVLLLGATGTAVRLTLSGEEEAGHV